MNFANLGHEELLRTNAVYRRMVLGDAPYSFWLGKDDPERTFMATYCWHGWNQPNPLDGIRLWDNS